ncbi:hypothetical protein C2I36_03285 [Rhodobacteraceae bacterium WD3A24]|nr:hypothetical protein C2I36_03285 [Rhodobacteraceae bacterium WD3A24]
MADRVAALMEERLGAVGTGLSEKLRRAGGRLPRRIRAEAARLAEADRRARATGPHADFDSAQLAQAYDACVGYLKSLGPWRRRWASVAHGAAGLILALLALAVAVLAVLIWRGFL